MTHRVQHTETKAKGTVTGEFVVPADRGGDCHGLWYHVDFDDGLQASVPAVLTEPITTIVRCPNGITTRHHNHEDAVQYADYGHCCVAVNLHQIRSI